MQKKVDMASKNDLKMNSIKMESKNPKLIDDPDWGNQGSFPPPNGSGKSYISARLAEEIDCRATERLTEMGCKIENGKLLIPVNKLSDVKAVLKIDEISEK